MNNRSYFFVNMFLSIAFIHCQCNTKCNKIIITKASADQSWMLSQVCLWIIKAELPEPLGKINLRTKPEIACIKKVNNSITSNQKFVFGFAILLLLFLFLRLEKRYVDYWKNACCVKDKHYYEPSQMVVSG